MVKFIDQQKESWGVEPICQSLPIAPSTYHLVKSKERNPEKCSLREKRDNELKVLIRKVWDENYQVYGARKVWHQLLREGHSVARCTIERLMKELGLQGAVRGQKPKNNWISDQADTPEDLVKRDFQVQAPNRLWVADFTYVSTWAGFVYVAFVIDAYANFIVGWRVSNRMTSELTLDALEQALWARPKNPGLIHHSDHGSQYLSIRYTERLKDAKLEASVGTVGDAYDNALAETINGLYKTEVIRKRKSWKSLNEVEFATLEWVHWYNNKRLLSSIGNRPPAEMEAMFYNQEKHRSVGLVHTQ